MRFSRVFLAKLENRGSICRKRGRVQKRRSDHVRERTGENVGTHQRPSRFADVGGDRVGRSVGGHVMVALYVLGSNR